VKKASFASAEQTLELTGMQIGGVTPFGLPDIPIYIDSAVMNNEEVVLGGGNRSTKVLLNPKELQKLPGAQVVEGLASPR
jgi:prolyl-tRNA editing enzyme YbaK/EbsC (Cys-tRNA(Pro) deacylase)